MANERDTPEAIRVESIGAPVKGVPSIEEIARRRRIVSDMRWLRDDVIGRVDGSIAELLSEDGAEPAVNE